MRSSFQQWKVPGKLATNLNLDSIFRGRDAMSKIYEALQHAHMEKKSKEGAANKPSYSFPCYCATGKGVGRGDAESLQNSRHSASSF
jgi:hypothetical protein